MLTQERYQAILNILNEKNAVTVAELTNLLDTSESTIRRDLNTLDEMGKLKKVFGGATSVAKNSGVLEAAVSSRENVMIKEKSAVANYAAGLINDNDFVYIDAGTTTSRLADYISNSKATYVTNGIAHARKLIQKGFTAYILGGKIKPVTEAVVGAEGIRSIANFNFTKAFMGTNGIDLEAGFTTPDIEESLIKEKAIKQSYMTFVLADNTKFGKIFPATFSKLEKCCIITDILTDKRFADKTVIKEVQK
ncbi:MAG: DeoR/GlpR family DNA-binding transcription regulator [bacterium]|nr:DeoR/GlpR family DNA-binding transcription regulator [bacterium]MDY3861555.1 DeoR/GlpR family DNA-binding transcription regulator [Ruminococcus sp.]